MDQSILNSKEFVAAIVGAIVGGVMSMAASLLSVHLQNAKQTKAKETLVRDFVVEHAAYFKELVDRLVAHFDQKTEVWVENVIEIKTAYEVALRNFEHLVLLTDKDERKACRKYFSDIFFISQRCWFWQNQIYENQKSVESAELENKGAAELKVRDGFSNMKNCVADLKNAGAAYFELERRFTTNRNG